MNKIKFQFFATLILISACNPPNKYKTTGSIEKLDSALDQIISPEAQLEVIAEGYEWSEGPLWIDADKKLLFSDVPKNTVYQWTEETGSSVYLTPSGYTGSVARGGEPGSNGLLLFNSQLVLCQHGDRRLAIMESAINDPKPIFKTIGDRYDGKKFNSPNDAVVDSNGNFYVTDPPYGLVKNVDDPAKETPYQGVYKIDPAGKVTLLVDSLTRPNGIALSPDEKSLFVANSDPAKARWYKFELSDSGITAGKIYYDVTNLTATEKGLPDGMKIDNQGTIFASGPGGLFIFNAEGKLVGRIKIPEATSNCALSSDEKTLFITSDMLILRLKMR
jgi:gluconolactonase